MRERPGNTVADADPIADAPSVDRATGADDCCLGLVSCYAKSGAD
jgi:hypothetical protein